jgi:hypothetical protein
MKNINDVIGVMDKMTAAISAVSSTVVADRTNNLKLFEVQKAVTEDLIGLLSRTLTRLDIAETKIETLEAKIAAMSGSEPVNRTPGAMKSAAQEMWQRYKYGSNT